MSQTSQPVREWLRTVFAPIALPFDWALGRELDRRRYPFGKQNGFSAVTFFAGFASLQAAIVTTALNFNTPPSLVLSIFCVTSVMLLHGLSSVVLRAESGLRKRVYDQGTIDFGRWTFAWTLLLLFGIVGGYAFGLWNLEKRAIFDKDEVEIHRVEPIDNLTTTEVAIDGHHLSLDETLAYQSFFGLMEKKSANGDGASSRGCYVILCAPFNKKYFDFSTQLIGPTKGGFRAVEQSAFLYSNEVLAGRNRPRFELLPFEIDTSTGEPSNRIRVLCPDAGERVLVVLDVESTSGTFPSDASELGLSLKVRRR